MKLGKKKIETFRATGWALGPERSACFFASSGPQAVWRVSAKQPAGRNSQKNTEKIGDIPNPKKNKAKNVHFSAERLQYSKKNPVWKQKKNEPKM